MNQVAAVFHMWFAKPRSWTVVFRAFFSAHVVMSDGKFSEFVGCV